MRFLYTIPLISLLLLLGNSTIQSVIEAPAVPPTTVDVIKSSRTDLFDTLKTDLSDYIWPTDASMKVTSSFAEYRTTHFHGGIDISTNGVSGYKVFSVRDGYVYRIRITPNGYGKMMYVKHKDGYYSTYAHLLTFSDTVNAAARQEQYRKGTFAIDLTLDSTKIPVKKGDIIAYTGESGFGPPHLHFEIRDENQNPINPMLCKNYEIQDNIPPRIQRVMVTPLSFNSNVENAPRTKMMSRFPGKNHRYRIPQTIRVHGMIGFSVDASDRKEGTYSKAGVHKMELYLDDSLIYAMHLDRVPADETKEIDLHYDFPTLLRGWGKFQKLYIDKGNSLPFYDQQPVGTGIINTDAFNEGEHEYRIVCKDIHDNSTEITGKLLANHQPALQISQVGDDEITLVGNALESVEKCYLFGRKNTSPDWIQHTLPKGRFENAENKKLLLPVRTKDYDVIKIMAESKWGSRSAPMFYFNKKPQGTPREIHLSTDIFNDYVQFTLSATGVFTSPPTLTVQEGEAQQTVHLDAIDLYKYYGVFVPSPTYAGLRIVHTNAEINGKPSSTSDSFDLYSIPTDRSTSFTVFNNILTISFDSAAVYKPLNMEISSDVINNSNVYILEPEDVLLNKGIKVSVKAGDNAELDHRALYFRANGGWTFQTSTLDKGGNTFSTMLTRTLGELTIFRDEQPPMFERLHTSAQRGIANVSFRYHDNLSGVDPDEIKMYVDDKLVIPEIDGEHNRVWYKGEEHLSKGKHSLRVTMSDRMKNESEVSRVLTVK